MRALQSDGGLLGVKVAGFDQVQGFGEDGRKVVVFGVAGDAALGGAAGLPEFRAGIADGDGVAYLNRKVKTQPEEGDGLVLFGAAALRGVRLGAAGSVGEGDLGLDLVAVLTAWTACAALGEVALLEEFGVGEGGRVHERGYASGSWSWSHPRLGCGTGQKRCPYHRGW